MSGPEPAAVTTAVVTGAGRGLGREFAIELARRGVRVMAADIDLEGAQQTCAAVRNVGGRALAVRCDVRSSEDMADLARQAETCLGGTDILINNAGVLVAGELAGLTLDDYRRVIDVNLWGVLHGCHYFVPMMKKRQSGTIINVASLAGALSLPHMGAYNATKAAVIALSETMHAELAASGISVTALCPSFVRTGFIDEATGAASRGTLRFGEALTARLGSWPKEVVRVALDAADRGKLYAVPTLHGRLAWRAKRLAPELFKHAMALVHRTVTTNDTTGNATSSGLRHTR